MFYMRDMLLKLQRCERKECLCSTTGVCTVDLVVVVVAQTLYWEFTTPLLRGMGRLLNRGRDSVQAIRNAM